MLFADGDKTLQLTEQTLAEQLQITDREIEDRKQLLDFSPEDAEALTSLRAYIHDHLDEIVDEFYGRQKANTEFALLIGDSETFRRLHASMHRYVLELFEGFYDAEYVNKRLRIGKVHKRIGVSPKLYLSGMTQLEMILQRYVRDAQHNSKVECEHCQRTASALHKLLMFDVQFVFDTYIHSLVSEVETTKHKVELYAASLEQTVVERTQELEQLSRQDPLTGLENQRAFYEHLRRELSRAERNKTALTLVYIDLNLFKQLNDTQGHKAGDEVLRLTGQSMKEVSRTSDICCRCGGDEFCIILPDTDQSEALRYAERLIEEFDKHNNSPVSFSIGLSQTGCDNYVHSDTLVRQADQSMYRAKAVAHKNGGHQIDRTANALTSVQGNKAERSQDDQASHPMISTSNG